MPIEFRCPVCSQNLRVADEHAGLQAKCPQCGHLATVPSASAASGLAPGAFPALPTFQAAAASPRAEQPVQTGTADLWKLRTRTGDTFGPVTRAELDHWLADGRVDAGSYVQQEGWTQWKSAGEVYPSLAPSTNNPYGPPSTEFGGGGYNYGYVKPHRGTMVLILGVLSITMCPLTGIAAWLMGSADLREIRAGRMDRSGEGTTQAGYVCGIIGTVLFLLQLGIFVLYIMFIIVFVAAAGP